MVKKLLYILIGMLISPFLVYSAEYEYWIAPGTEVLVYGGSNPAARVVEYLQKWKFSENAGYQKVRLFHKNSAGYRGSVYAFWLDKDTHDVSMIFNVNKSQKHIENDKPYFIIHKNQLKIKKVK